jgi:hypothetical protein
VEDGIIIVIVERVPETILKAKILLILSIQIAATLQSDLSDIVAVVNRMRRGPTTMIGSKLDRMLRTMIWGLLH